MDVAGVYRTTRESLLELARSVDHDGAAAPVPALPGWTVKDAYAHLTGLCADVLDGRLEGAGTPEWTARQVAERAGDSFEDVGAEWSRRGPELDAALTAQGEQAPVFVALDVWNHEQDIRGALGLPGCRDARARELAATALAAFDQRFTDASVPALAVVHDGAESVLGTGNRARAATLRIDDYEAMRVLFGRRSRAQIEAADWTGDPEPYLDHLHLFPLPLRDLHE